MRLGLSLSSGPRASRSLMIMSEIESRTSAVSTLRSLRLPSPLIKPDVRISRILLSDRLHSPAHGDTTGRLRRAVQLFRKSSDPCGVVRLLANHRSSTSSKARLKQGSFPPPALPGFSGTMTISDSHRVRIAATMEPKLHPNGSPRLPASPFRRAVPTTPADRMGPLSTFCPIRTAFPGLGGSASATALSRPAQASPAFGPPDRSTAQGGLCHEASDPPVTRRSRSSATSPIDSSLGESFLHC